MATDFAKLRQNEFWEKKMDRAVRVRDTNKSGDISRADFELVVEHYRNLGTSNPTHIEVLSKYMLNLIETLHLTDESTTLSYDEFKEKFLRLVEEWTKNGTYKMFFGAMFSNLDVNGDGYISLEEWTAHYNSMGIDPGYARASFEAMDVNGDGKISKEEFVNYHYEYYFTTENKLNSSVLYGPLE